ncbi:MAG: class II glutamine amidotransferase, partial [Paracoccaceae bacterium]|nr:class II glutamine amidotransferase [Paracoccaceae bacterium]
MCRIAAYTGPAIPLENIVVRPAHSLLTQSQHANEAKLAVNGDGFGIAWYGDDTRPGLYRDVLPSWADGNLLSLCRMMRSSQFIAHVRAGTVGETSRANCHPFTYDNWSFCHNGQIPHFASIRRRMEAALPDNLFASRRGTTDSEMIFLTLLA